MRRPRDAPWVPCAPARPRPSFSAPWSPASGAWNRPRRPEWMAVKTSARMPETLATRQTKVAGRVSLSALTEARTVSAADIDAKVKKRREGPAPSRRNSDRSDHVALCARLIRRPSIWMFHAAGGETSKARGFAGICRGSGGGFAVKRCSGRLATVDPPDRRSAVPGTRLTTGGRGWCRRRGGKQAFITPIPPRTLEPTPPNSITRVFGRMVSHSDCPGWFATPWDDGARPRPCRVPDQCVETSHWSRKQPSCWGPRGARGGVDAPGMCHASG
jgi:hypothetical protein